MLFLVTVTINIVAQNSAKTKIQIIGKCSNDSVILRWVPGNYLNWKQALSTGFIIERSLFAKDSSEILKQPFEVVKKNIKCLSLEEMKNKLGPKSEFGAIAAQSIYGKETAINVEKPGDLKNASVEQKNKFGFAMYAAENDPEVANSIGVRWVDKGIKKGYYYVYKIYLNSNEFDTGFCVVSTMQKEVEMALPELQIKNLEKEVKLNWNISEFSEVFSGYYIEKRKLNSATWTRLNKRPMIRATNEENPKEEMFFSDSLQDKYVKYEYRLLGLTPFAEVIASKFPVIGYCKDLTPPEPPTDVAVSGTEQYHLILTWKKEEKEADFFGFHIQKAYFPEGPFATISENILSKSTTQFIDKNYDPFNRQYYRVVALDTASNASVSQSIYGYFSDSIAPSTPATPKGEISEKGIAKIIWNLGPEKDIKGYRIYRANQEDHQYINITPYPITDTVFYDTLSLNTLSKKVYYKIAALDYHFNHSAKSEILELKRPDVVRPSNPVFKDILVTDSVVMVQWFNSPSDDIKQTWLLRRTNNEAIEVLSKFEGKTVSSYADKKVIPGNNYYYFLLAVDESNLYSDTSHPVDAMVSHHKLKTAVSNFVALKSEKGKTINLTWKYPTQTNQYFVIYRQFGTGPMVSYKHVDGNTLNYEDWDLPGKGIYTYQIAVFFTDGTQSKMSKTANVVVE